MRKNTNTINNIKEVYEVYEIKGLNLDRLVDKLYKNGITLYDVNKISNKKMNIRIKKAQTQKFFAITKEMCYTKRKIKTMGKGYPIFYLIKNLGVTIGIVLFIALSIFFNDVIFSFSFSGSGSIYQNNVIEYLNLCGIKEFSRFSSIDLSSLSDAIVKNNANVLFAQCSKKGNRLHVELIKKEQDIQISGQSKSLVSNCEGILQEVKVYRGTAVKNVGDKVSVGDVIVDGYATIKDKIVETNVIATAYVKVFENFTYTSYLDNDSEKAIEYARLLCENQDCIVENLVKIDQNGKYIYQVTISYVVVIWTG